ncbi:hypothetical protein GCM10028868_25090 [Virgibacillus kimchii]
MGKNAVCFFPYLHDGSVFDDYFLLLNGYIRIRVKDISIRDKEPVPLSQKEFDYAIDVDVYDIGYYHYFIYDE